MCGIAGIINPDRSLQTGVLIHRMNQTMRHRGPDDEGYLLFNNKELTIAKGDDSKPFLSGSKAHIHIKECTSHHTLAFGHRRLSIIDTSAAGHQPMASDNQQSWIIFNGEIYNYIELRNELKIFGHSFTSESDTEVLLKAYTQWGTACVDKLNGMWAFVILDLKKNLIFGARDRIGVKPFYIYNDTKVFAFASEPKALMALPMISKSIDESSIFDYLACSTVERNGHYMIRGIQELPASHAFIYHLKELKLNIYRYYTLNFTERISHYQNTNANIYAQKTRELMQKAVSVRLRSDVPIGFCLSGGIDSSTIVSIAAKINQTKNIEQLGKHLRTFTSINGERGFDESDWAQITAHANHVYWQKTLCTAKDLNDKLQAIIHFQDYPLLSTSTYAQSKVMELASQNGIKILLDGQGGDELFGGYSTFYTSLWLSSIRKLKPGLLINELLNVHNAPFSLKTFAQSIIKISLDQLPESFKPAIANKLKPELKYINKEHWQNKHYSFAGDFSSLDLNSLLHHYYTAGYLKNLLRWEDRCSMQYSIESRTPFSDDLQLMEAIFKIPASYKIHNGWSKKLLRESMRGIIPDAIRNRRDKLGFATPQRKWLTAIAPQMKEGILQLAYLDDYKFIHIDLLLHNWGQIFSSQGAEHSQDLVWRYYNYLLWLSQIKKGGSL